MAAMFHGETSAPADALAEAAALIFALDDAESRCWLIDTAQGVAGYVFVRLAGADALLEELFVVEDRRGGGLGRSAMGEMAAALAGTGCRSIAASIDIYEPGAYLFYRLLGYRQREPGEMVKELE
ncbi:MAG: GNAT family N-acetyltransferase [Rhodospirillaceae bacterium]|nr:GNAT family N-acetyltransferase [Rhodospirillaceae bacterium]